MQNGSSSKNNIKHGFIAPDEVVKAINDMTSLVIESHGENPDQEAGRKAVGEIVLAMRKDLLGKTKLNYNNFQYTDVVDKT